MHTLEKLTSIHASSVIFPYSRNQSKLDAILIFLHWNTSAMHSTLSLIRDVILNPCYWNSNY